MTAQTPPKNKSKYKEFLWRKLIWSRLQNIIYFFQSDPIWSIPRLRMGCRQRDRASHYNAGIMSAMASQTSNGSWCMGIKGEMSGTVCVTFTWDVYIYIYIYIYIWVVYSLCFFWCLFITVTWWYVWCIEWASGNQEEVQACLVTFWLFIIPCYSLYKTTLGLLCTWFENNPHFHKYSMDLHVQCVYLNYFLWEIWLK